MYELSSVDFLLFGEAGLQPGLLQGDSLCVLAHEIPEILIHTNTEILKITFGYVVY